MCGLVFLSSQLTSAVLAQNVLSEGTQTLPTYGTLATIDDPPCPCPPTSSLSLASSPSASFFPLLLFFSFSRSSHPCAAAPPPPPPTTTTSSSSSSSSSSSYSFFSLFIVCISFFSSSSFPGLLPSNLRLVIQDPEKTTAFATAITGDCCIASEIPRTFAKRNATSQPQGDRCC